MESLSILGVIYRVAKEIAKAARGARQCKSRCLELARRVEVVAELVRESEAAPSDSATRTRVLDRLKDALDEALEVVQSCRSFTKLLLAGSSTTSRIDGVERKINNCLLELGVANDVRLVGPGSQSQPASARRLVTHGDGVVPRTSTPVVNYNSGIVMNINSKLASVSSKQQSSMRTYINAGGSVNNYFWDGSSSSRNGTKEGSVAAIHNNSRRVSASAGGSSRHVSIGDTRRQDVTTMPMRGKRWDDDKNGQAAARGKRIAPAAAGPQKLSTTRPGASDMSYWRSTRAAPGRDFHPRRSESDESGSTESRASLPVFRENRPWTPPPQGLQDDCQHPYGGAGDHGVVGYYYNYNHPSFEEDPNSCSTM